MDWCDERAVSPVIGSVLLVALVSMFGAMAAFVFFGLTEEREAQPEVVLELQTGEHGVVHILHHQQGEVLEGDKVELQGAGDPNILAGTRFQTTDEQPLVAVDDEIQVIYHGEHGTSYTMATFEADTVVSGSTEGCGWVKSETDDGVEDIKIEGIVVHCDIKTNKGIELREGGVIVGETISFNKELDAEDSTIYGNANVETVLNLQNGTITGNAVSETEDVKLSEATAEGDVSAEKVVELQSGSTVGGDVMSQTADAKVLSSSRVHGSVTADGTVKLDDATVEGHVYADPSDFDCTDSMVNGQDCDAYSPRDPADW